MKGLVLVGVLLLVLGALALTVPVPQRQTHGVSLGGAKFSVETETNQKLPPVVGTALLAGGVLALLLGLRKN